MGCPGAGAVETAPATGGYMRLATNSLVRPVAHAPIPVFDCFWVDTCYGK